MYLTPLAKFISVLSIISSAIGTICYFVNPIITIFCGIITIINSIIQVFYSNQNNFATEIVTTIIAIIVAIITHNPIIETIFFALCMVEILFSIIGWIYMLYMFIIYKNKF